MMTFYHVIKPSILNAFFDLKIFKNWFESDDIFSSMFSFTEKIIAYFFGIIEF